MCLLALGTLGAVLGASLHTAIDTLGIQPVSYTHLDVYKRQGQNELTVSTLGAQALGLGITAILGGAHTFFMGEELQTDIQHNSVPSFL